MRLLSEQWGHAGGLGRELYVLQHLDELVGTRGPRLKTADLGELSVVDGGDGQSYARALADVSGARLRLSWRRVGLVLGTDMRRSWRESRAGREPSPSARAGGVKGVFQC